MPFGIPLPPMPERIRPLRVGRPRRSRRCSSDAAAAAARRHPPRSLLPARRRDEPAAAADARRPADLARRPEATRPRARRPAAATAGCCRRSRDRRHRLLQREARRDPRALAAIGRDPAGFDVRGPGADRDDAPKSRRAAVEAARGFVGAGATHLILGMPARLGPAGSPRSPARSPTRSARRSGERDRRRGRGCTAAGLRAPAGRPDRPARPRRPTTRSATPTRAPGASPPRTSPAAATRIPRPAEREERRYVRLLLIMVGVIVAGGLRPRDHRQRHRRADGRRVTG